MGETHHAYLPLQMKGSTAANLGFIATIATVIAFALDWTTATIWTGSAALIFFGLAIQLGQQWKRYCFHCGDLIHDGDCAD